MDARCEKYWADGSQVVAQWTANGTPSLKSKVLKELKTMSRFLQRNQSSRFSDNAQQKLLETIALYVTLGTKSVAANDDRSELLEAVLEVVKDGLAMPFTVFGTKQKKRLMKWYNELMGAESTGTTATGHAEQAKVVWTVLALDEDEGILSLLNDETGDTDDSSFQLPTKSNQFQQIAQAMESQHVQVVTCGDQIVDIHVSVVEED